MAIQVKIDCSTCYYKFINSVKKVSGWCYMFKMSPNHVPCTQYKNDIVINKKPFHFIDPLAQ